MSPPISGELAKQMTWREMPGWAIDVPLPCIWDPSVSNLPVDQQTLVGIENLGKVAWEDGGSKQAKKPLCVPHLRQT